MIGRLDLYLVKKYLKILATSTLALLSIYVTIDFVEQIRKYLNESTQLVDIISYLIFKIPGILYQVTPLSILLSTLIVLGALAYDNEITAMRAAGIRLERITASFLLFALLISIFLLAADRSLIPTMKERAQNIRTTALEQQGQKARFTKNRVWLKVSSNTFMNIQLIDLTRSTLFGVSLYRLSQDFVLEETIVAKELRYEDNHWALISGVKSRFFNDGSTQSLAFDREPFDFKESPLELQARLTVDPNNLTLKELRNYVIGLKKNGYPTAKYSVEYYGRYAFPFASLIMAIIGASIILMDIGIRRKHFARSIGLTLLIGFHYWIIHTFSLGIGKGNLLPPMLAGWMANIVFFGIGVFLILRIRQ